MRNYSAELPGQGVQRSVSVNAAGSFAAEARHLHVQEIKDAEAQLASAGYRDLPSGSHGLMSGMEGSAASEGSVYSDTAISGRALGTLSTQQSNQATMEEVALQTGGKAYKNQNEIKDGITLAVSDEKASYSLGYYPENKKWDGKFRSLKVKLDHPDTHVRYRKGFFAVEPGPTKTTNYDQEVAAALGIGAPATQVWFMAQAKPTDPGKVRVVFLVDAHTLSAEDSGGSKKMSVSLYASLYDANGRNLGTGGTKVDQTFDAATYQKILEQGMKVPIEMNLPAGAKEVRAAVLDGKPVSSGPPAGRSHNRIGKSKDKKGVRFRAPFTSKLHPEFPATTILLRCLRFCLPLRSRPYFSLPGLRRRRFPSPCGFLPLSWRGVRHASDASRRGPVRCPAVR